MFVRRYLLLLLILSPATFVAESLAGEGFSVPYYNESGVSPFFSPAGWLPGRKAFSMPERFRDQGLAKGVGSESHATNPWSLPVSQWAPAMPQSLGTVFSGNNYSQTPQYLPQAGRPNAVSPGFHFPEWRTNGQPNLPVSSPQSHTESVWHQPPGFQQERPIVAAPTVTMHPFQQRPRFVTPDILDALNRQQMQAQQTFSSNSDQSSFQKKQPCCRNGQRRMKDQNTTHRTHQWANKQNYQQDYLYSNGSTMPFTLDAGQLNNQRLLYMGDSLPAVPDAAISGLPPMNIFEPLPQVLSGSGNDIDWGMNRFGIGPYGDFLQ